MGKHFSGPAGAAGTPGKTEISTTAPTSPTAGDLWWSSTTGKLLIRYGDAWITATTPGKDGTDGTPPTFSALDSNLVPATDSSLDLGSPTKKWKSLYLSSNTLFLGDSGSISAGAGGEIILPSIKIGTGTNSVKLEATSEGGLAQTGTNSSGTTAPAKEAGAAKTVTDMPALVALTGMATGETCLVTSLNRIFMYTGSGWFKIADMTNASPTDITGVESTYSLATDGTATVITAVSTDPEGFPLTWSYAVTTGSLGSTATVSQADNVFTITPSSTEADAGEFSITFSVTDGATGAVNAVSAFTLAFGPATFSNTLDFTIINPSGNAGVWGHQGGGFNSTLYAIGHSDQNEVRVYYTADNTQKYLFSETPNSANPAVSRFGICAISETQLAVSAYNSSGTGWPGTGMVYVFNLSDGSQETTLGNSTTIAYLGYHMAWTEDGSKLIVGAPYEGNGTSSVGRVRVYDKNNSWALTTLNEISTGYGVSGTFNRAVGGGTNHFAVGSPQYASGYGTVHIHSNTSPYTVAHQINGSGGAHGFGDIVDCWGDYVIIGTHIASGDNLAYVYRMSTGALIAELGAIVTAAGQDATGGHFGEYVGIGPAGCVVTYDTAIYFFDTTDIDNDNITYIAKRDDTQVGSNANGFAGNGVMVSKYSNDTKSRLIVAGKGAFNNAYEGKIWLMS